MFSSELNTDDTGVLVNDLADAPSPSGFDSEQNRAAVHLLEQDPCWATSLFPA